MARSCWWPILVAKIFSQGRGLGPLVARRQAEAARLDELVRLAERESVRDEPTKKKKSEGGLWWSVGTSAGPREP